MRPKTSLGRPLRAEEHRRDGVYPLASLATAEPNGAGPGRAVAGCHTGFRMPSKGESLTGLWFIGMASQAADELGNLGQIVATEIILHSLQDL